MVPCRSRRATRSARPAFSVHTAPVSPYTVPLAIATAASSAAGRREPIARQDGPERLVPHAAHGARPAAEDRRCEAPPVGGVLPLRRAAPAAQGGAVLEGVGDVGGHLGPVGVADQRA